MWSSTKAAASGTPIPTSHRVHLINGYLVEKMTQKPPHVIADDLCGQELARVLPGWYIRAAKPIRLPGQASEPEPDRCVVQGTILDYAERHPGPDDVALVVEVADASLADDRKLAAEVYGPAGIPVYWLVDVNGRRVEVYTVTGPQGYGPPAIFAKGQSIPVTIDGREVRPSPSRTHPWPAWLRAEAEDGGALIDFRRLAPLWLEGVYGSPRP